MSRLKKFDEINVPGKFLLRGKLCVVAYLSTLSMCPSVDMVKTKVHKKKKGKTRYQKEKNEQDMIHLGGSIWMQLFNVVAQMHVALLH